MRAPYTPDQLNYKTAKSSPLSDKPKFYRIKLVKDGPPVGLKYWYGQPLDPVTGEILDRSPRWIAEVNGKPADLAEIAPWVVEGLGSEVKGEEISADEYLYLTALHDYAINHDATAPEANIRTPVDRRKLAPILPPRS